MCGNRQAALSGLPIVWPLRLWCRARRRQWRAAFALLHGLAQEVFDLAVHAAQFILRPGFQFAPEHWVNP